ncbi:MAG: DNA translocase FtsK 4TM domain-containing protein, partial [Pseudomonadota bacterium]
MTLVQAGGRRRRERPRFFEEQTETALRRRVVELIGLAILFVGCVVFAMLWTYDPADPSIFSATDAAPSNALGLLGALAADPVHRAFGWAAFLVPTILVTWGMRLIMHRGEERVLTRLILSPVALAVAALFASAHVPLSGWPHVYGLGGMIGDSLFLGLVSVIPAPVELAATIGTLIAAAFFVVTAAAALGVDRLEARQIFGFLGFGLVTAAAGFRDLTKGAANAAKRSSPRAEPELKRSTTPEEPPVVATPATDLADPPPPEAAEERVMARIAAAVKARDRAVVPAPMAVDAEPDLPAEPFEPDPQPHAPMPRAETPEPLVRQPERRAPAKSTRAKREEQPRLALGEPERETYDAPPLSVLENPATIE